MILGLLENGKRVIHCHPGFEAAFAFLRDMDLAALPEGRHEITGDGTVYALVMESPGRGRAGARLEAHRRAIDIQVTVHGEEFIGWRPTAACTPQSGYDPDADVEFFADAPWLWAPVPPGSYAVFFPEDAHAPLAGTETLRKVVIKIRLRGGEPQTSAPCGETRRTP